MKSEVYSWRLAPETKQAIEDEARRQGRSIADLLDALAQDWLTEHRVPLAAQEQERIRRSALRWVGALTSGNRRLAERARELVRARLRQRHAR